MRREEMFKKFLIGKRFSVIQKLFEAKDTKDIKILLITHDDLDGSGPVMVLHMFFNDCIDVIHTNNSDMDFTIRNTAMSEESEKYDAIFITDISCTLETAEEIFSSNIKDKVFLLDHHGTAMELNKYPFAIVAIDNPEDSFSHEYYEDKTTTGKCSATTLIYDFLLYSNSVIHHRIVSSENIEFSEIWCELFTKDNKINEFFDYFCFSIGIFDTWDWVNVFKRNTHDTLLAQQLNDIFYIYGIKMFDKIYIDKVHKNSYKIIDWIDNQEKMLLELENEKITSYVNNKKINCLHKMINGKDYNICYAFAEQYLSQMFEKMQETYPEFSSDNPNGINFYIIVTSNGISFRSRGDYSIDVSKIAKLFGGGGHPQAAGCSLDSEKQKAFIRNLLSV